MALKRISTLSIKDDELPLHEAILNDRTDDLELLLCTPCLDINLQDKFNRTPLFLSLKRKCSKSVIMQLIRAGCDVNIPNVMGVTPLHLAISLSLNDIAYELINRGANINAQENGESSQGDLVILVNLQQIWINWFNENTPLHLAVEHNNLEGVCMLLYYGVDVYITSSPCITPLKLAMFKRLEDIAVILINYYDETYLYEPEDDYVGDPRFKFVLTYSIEYQNADMFKLFWNRNHNFENILNHQDANSLLVAFLKRSGFSTSDWLECVYLILNIFVASQFTIYYRCKGGTYYDDDDDGTETFFYLLFNAFDKKNIELTDRLTIINICLSLNAPVWVADIDVAHKRFGFKEELERLIYSNISYENVELSSWRSRLCCNLILFREEHFLDKLPDEVFFCSLQESRASRNVCTRPTSHFVGLLGYFSVPASVKQEIQISYRRYDETGQIFEKLQQVHEFPSLLELSRNQVRKCIKQFNKLKYPYQYHDAVKKLNLPKLVEDIIRLKIPIYQTVEL